MRRLILLIGLLKICAAEERCKPCDDDETELCCPADDSVSLPVRYLLSIPSTLTAATSQTACLTIHRNSTLVLPVAMNISVRLHNSNDSYNYDKFETIMDNTEDEICFELQAPDVILPRRSETRLAVITVDIRYVIGTEQFFLTSTKNLLIYPPNVHVYINTDKQKYNPGQTVLFRILQLADLHPTNYMVDEITITDPKSRKLLVLRDRKPKTGLVSDKFELVAEPSLGIWEIKVKLAGKKYSTTFEVSEYVLPKFEVTIELPKYLDVETDLFPVKVCAKYTYGKPVTGSVDCEISVSSYSWMISRRPVQSLIGLSTDSSGCVSIVGDPDVLEFRNVDHHFDGQKLIVVAKVTETFTGVMVSEESDACLLTVRPFIINVEDKKKLFKPGLPYRFGIYYHDIAGKPLSERDIVVGVTGYAESGNELTSFSLNTTTDAHGRSEVTLQTLLDVERYSFTIFDQLLPPAENNDFWWRDTSTPMKNLHHNVFFSVHKLKSSTKTFIDINLLQGKTLNCHQFNNLSGTVVSFHSQKRSTPEIFYRVSVRNNMVDHGIAQQMNSSCERTPQGLFACYTTFYINMFVKDWIPKAHVLVYLAQGDDIIADDISIPSECFGNTATLTVNVESALPGQNVEISLSAHPESLCALSVVDKSVHVLGGDNSLTTSQIKPHLTDETNSDLVVLDDPCRFYNINDRYVKIDGDYLIDSWSYPLRRKRSLIRDYIYPRFEVGKYSAFTSFKNSRIVYLTNYDIPRYCDVRPIAMDMTVMAMEDNLPVAARSMILTDVDATEETIAVRNFFPETWKWDLLDIGSDGQASLVDSLPDTITEWVATSYCISPASGIAVSNVARVKGFKPIFLSVSMPYSVIRGEEITLKSVLFNYFEKSVCLEMVISLDQSEDFILLQEGTSSTVRCVCGGNAESIQYAIRPMKLGKIKFTLKTWSRDGHICGKETDARPEARDGVERFLLVEPEGVEEETTINDFVCLEGDVTSLSRTANISVPDDHYEGSSRLLVNVIGSIMGPVLDNLQHLIKAPYGCGEQNMVTMVPNIVVHKYLSAVGKMTPALKEAIESNIRSGYQRQLNYQRHDGSFSAFGDSDSSGSTWLTAFVISTFNQAKEYIFIDEAVIDEAIKFIHSNTKENGCVKKVGLVHNKRMMGGADGLNALDAYVYLALHQHEDSTDEESSLNVVGCDGSTDLKIYTKAIKFYTNALKRIHSAAEFLWDSLKVAARLENGESFDNAAKIFWSDEEPNQESDNTWWYYRKPSDAVEVTGYILLGYLEMGESFPERYPIIGAYPIAQWLTSQRNAFGGFSSTQNTIIGLRALAAYATKTYISSTDLTVTLTSGQQTLFTITDENSMVVQQSLISPPPTEITYTVEGQGCALVQTNLKYNTPREPVDPSFSVSVHVRSNEGGCSEPDLRLLVFCASYQGTFEQPSSNMAVLEITMVSGYEADQKSLKTMAEKNVLNGLKRYERDGNKVNIYFRAISSERKCAAFEVKQVQEVKNPQPGLVHVYDYYEPVKSATTSYNLACIWETYNQDLYTADCMQWGDDGDCRKSCLQRQSSSACSSYEVVTPLFDFCKHFGSDHCGDAGDCKNTATYFRCSCHPGFKNSKWGNRCIPIEEDENEDVVVIQPPPPFNFSLPECNADNICPIAPIAFLEGESTILVCADGYEFVNDGNNTYCGDIDECLDNPCDGDSQACLNYGGQYKCACKEGYEHFVDEDENIEDFTICTPVDKRPLLPELVPERKADKLDRHADLLPDIAIESTESIAPGKLDHGCPTCFTNFPKASQMETIFCPKRNVFVVSKATEGAYNLRPIVYNGTSTKGAVSRDVEINIDDSCDCHNLQNERSLLVTGTDVAQDSDGTRQIYVGESYIIPKRATKKVQRYECP